MNFVPDITLGNLLVLAVPVITAIGVIYTMRATLGSLTERIGVLVGRQDRIDEHLGTLQRHVDKNLVERVELKELEARLDRRFGDVEHAVNRTGAQVIAALSGANPDLLPSRRRRPSA